MLQLKNIKKTYITGNLQQDALKDVNVAFRRNEFVSILGQSGSGKTTMLNIIGGLDRYTSGDLIINDVSTKDYQDKDWDSYRNHSVGFIFQSYNLIPHQSVLANVEIALTLSGVSKSERIKRAKAVLIDVGLEEHMHKKPSQMSGGQMQRVAIARALVNNPDILLADEPTGALDSETSLQIMELLKNIAKDKLVIMVTHNPELAEQYSTRIINLFDGEIINDSNPYNHSKVPEVKVEKTKKVSMSLFTAMSLSFSNLATKKGRTFLTAFAGSIGIIGIALILSLSSGMQAYIMKVQEDTLTAYPITIASETIDLASMQENNMSIMLNQNKNQDLDKIYQGGFIGDRLQMQTVQIQNNNLQAFSEYLNDKDTKILDNTSAVLYDYGLNIQVYTKTNDEYIQVNPSPLYEDEEVDEMQAMMSSSFGVKNSIFSEMLDNQELLETQYEVLEGTWPKAYNEVVIKLDENNQISDMALYVLGLKDSEQYQEIKSKIENGESVSADDYAALEFDYQDFLDLDLKLLLNTDYFENNGDIWTDQRINQEYMDTKLDSALELKVVGIVRPAEDSLGDVIGGTIGYTPQLIQELREQINTSEIAKAQMENKDVDVFNNKSFTEEIENPEDIVASLNDAQRAYFMSLSEEERVAFIESYSSMSKSTYDKNLSILGVVNEDKPSSINLYLKNFESRDIVINSINEYNDKMIADGNEDLTITYTDIVGMMISSMITIIDLITYALIAFVSISLVVSSIMIGIITYISVLERVKEIGILRSVGASKKDIIRVFISETMLVGLVSGLIGVGVTLLINIPVNAIIYHLAGVKTISSLPLISALVLITISVLLTTIAGIIPARMASKKDPVDALRND